MKLTFLGSGGAFTTENYNSNILIEQDGHKLLFDCGSDIKYSLKEQNISPLDIEAIYVSHLHSDHIGGLEYMGFLTYFMKTKQGGKPPKLIGDSVIIKDLWEHCLKGGMQSLQTIDANLNTYFDVNALNSTQFDFHGLTCKLVQTIHIVADTSFVRSFGLMITPKLRISEELNESDSPWRFPTHNQIQTKNPNIQFKKVFITSDSQFAPTQIKDFINMSDLVFHDCEISKYVSGVHAHYDDLKTLSPEIKKKMWLYHNDGERPDAKADGFCGFVDKGQVFEI